MANDDQDFYPQSRTRTGEVLTVGAVVAVAVIVVFLFTRMLVLGNRDVGSAILAENQVQTPMIAATNKRLETTERLVRPWMIESLRIIAAGGHQLPPLPPELAAAYPQLPVNPTASEVLAIVASEVARPTTHP